MEGQELTKREAKEYLTAPITVKKAMYLLKSIWPKAPEADVIKAGILCQQYGLNPLMRQVYLIQFDKEWVIVLGIKATRQIAQQALKKHGIRYSYFDGPRFMSEEEQKKLRGKVEPDKLWAITILQDSQGNKYPGYGFWSADKKPYGTDKGNDALNMAFIRSERNALDKLAPGELPDIEVADDSYIVADYKLALEEGKQEFQGEVEKDIKELWEGGKQPEPSPDAPQAMGKPVKSETSNKAPWTGSRAVEAPQGTTASPIDMDWLREQLTILQDKGLKAWTDKSVLDYVNAITKQKEDSIDKAVMHLSVKQAQDFDKRIQEIVESS